MGAPTTTFEARPTRAILALFASLAIGAAAQAVWYAVTGLTWMAVVWGVGAVAWLGTGALQQRTRVVVTSEGVEHREHARTRALRWDEVERLDLRGWGVSHLASPAFVSADGRKVPFNGTWRTPQGHRAGDLARTAAEEAGIPVTGTPANKALAVTILLAALALPAIVLAAVVLRG